MLFSHNIPTPVLQLAFLVNDAFPRDMKISNLFHIAAQNSVHEWEPGTNENSSTGIQPMGRRLRQIAGAQVPRHQVSREGVLTSDLQRGALCCRVMLDQRAAFHRTRRLRRIR